MDVVGRMKTGVDRLVALVCFLGGSRVYFKRGGEATFFAGPGITAVRRQAIYLLPRMQNPLSLRVGVVCALGYLLEGEMTVVLSISPEHLSGY